MKRSIEATALLVVIAAASLPATASAETARFRASLGGTYTHEGTTTNDNCYQPDGTDEGKTVSMTAGSTESDTFRSTKAITLTVSRVTGQRRSTRAPSSTSLRNSRSIARAG